MPRHDTQPDLWNLFWETPFQAASGLCRALGGGPPRNPDCAQGRPFVLQTAQELAEGAYQAASELGAQMLRTAGKSASDPAGVLRDLQQLLGDWADGPRLVEEYANKSQVFLLVLAVPVILGLPQRPPFPPLAESLQKAYSLPPYPALWAVEGLGKYHADTYWERCRRPRQILQRRRLADKSLTMLNAGIGLSFASHLGRRVRSSSPDAEIVRMLEDFLALVADNSTSGYAGAALESLGLVTRMGIFSGERRPLRMVRAVSSRLTAISEDAWEFFWHGVGRSIYFNPVNFVPCHTAIRQAIDMIVRQTPAGRARKNAIAGLAWAVTVVNMRQPGILAGFLESWGDRIPEPDAFSFGIASATLMRYDTTPQAGFIRQFCRFVPSGPSSAWERLAAEPCREGLQRWYPIIRRRGLLGELFRYHPSLAALARQPGNREADW